VCVRQTAAGPKDAWVSRSITGRKG
jgi:hypothetical protein